MSHTKQIAKSLIVVNHKSDCEALGWVNKGMSPIEWNVLNVSAVTCDENGIELNPEELIEKGTGYLFYEFCCGDKNCPAIKRVNAQEVVKI
jgi:hypothetical protein